MTTIEVSQRRGVVCGVCIVQENGGERDTPTGDTNTRTNEAKITLG